MISKVLSLFLILSIVSFAQPDPNTILDSVKYSFENIQDYSVDAEIKVEMEFLKVPVTKAKIYFKQPDKMRMESEGFALIPKQGFDLTPQKLLNFDYTAIYINTEEIDSIDCHKIKIIPNNDSTDIVLSTLWIDKNDLVIRKIESTSKTAGNFNINLDYADKKPLPKQIVLSFNLSSSQIADAIAMQTEGKKPKKKKMVGTVTITYNNYETNIGLEDSFFEEKENKAK